MNRIHEGRPAEITCLSGLEASQIFERPCTGWQRNLYGHIRFETKVMRAENTMKTNVIIREILPASWQFHKDGHVAW